MRQPRYKAAQPLKYENYPRCKQCGDEIPYEKRKYGAQFCCKECYILWRYGPPLPPRECDRTGCSNEVPHERNTAHFMRAYQRHYCSRECRELHAQELGILKDASEKGHEAQARYKAEYGHVPGIVQRREAALLNAAKGRGAMRKKRNNAE